MRIAGRVFVGALSLCGFVAGASGCGNDTLKSGGTDAGTPARDAVPDLVTVGVPVTGTFVAPGVSATIAFPGGVALLRQISYQSPPYQFYLGTGEVGQGTQVTFNGAPGIVSAAFAISLEIGAPLPREYPSASGCGHIALTADFSPDADANCGDLTDAGICPPGCTPRIDLVGGAPPCQVLTPGIAYQAVTNAECSYDSPGPLGDWTLSLTEVDSHFVVDGVLSSPGLYLVHGTLTAQLVGSAEGGADAGDGGLGTGTLQLEF